MNIDQKKTGILRELISMVDSTLLSVILVYDVTLYPQI